MLQQLEKLCQPEETAITAVQLSSLRLKFAVASKDAAAIVAAADAVLGLIDLDALACALGRRAPANLAALETQKAALIEAYLQKLTNTDASEEAWRLTYEALSQWVDPASTDAADLDRFAEIHVSHLLQHASPTSYPKLKVIRHLAKLLTPNNTKTKLPLAKLTLMSDLLVTLLIEIGWHCWADHFTRSKIHRFAPSVFARDH